MFNRDKAIQQLKKLFNTSPVRVIPATVLSIEGNTCTVQPVGSDLTLFDVRLFAEAEQTGVAIAPKPNTLVLVGIVGDKVDPAKLCVCQVMEADTISQTVEGFTIELNEQGATLVGPKGRIDLTKEVLSSCFQSFVPYSLQQTA
ncbi:hypothetical protein WBJ53_08705 [Spirosoma sp. SC4-14]|uniref:hypothetical protein n=1 Tax=Spirosoma sp. SC4-14 TaxID=3128900 RepID=UPI0030D5DB52